MNLNLLLRLLIKKSESPISGYDLTRKLRAKTKHAHQQVYRELEKCRKRGQVQFTKEPQISKPDKKMFTQITDEIEEYSIHMTPFRRTQAGYCILADDIRRDTDNYEKYIAHMEEAEKQILSQLNYEFSEPLVQCEEDNKKNNERKVRTKGKRKAESKEENVN